MRGNRIVAILVGIAIFFTLEYLAGVSWYIAFALGVIGYFVALWAIYERRRYKQEVDDLLEKAKKRGEPLP